MIATLMQMRNNNTNNNSMCTYYIIYEHRTWVVVNTDTKEKVVCFPTQIGATNWINKQH